MCWEQQHLRYLLLTTAQRVRGGGNMWALQRCVSTCCQTEGRARKHSWYWYWSSFKYSVLIFNWIFNHQWTQIGQRTVHTEAEFVQINTCRLSGCYVKSGKGLGYMKWMDYCFVANIPINYSLFFSTLLKFKVLTFSHIHSLWRDTPTPTHQPVAFRRTAGSNVNPATPGCFSFKCLVVLLTSLGNNFGQPTWKNLDKSADHHRADE